MCCSRTTRVDQNGCKAEQPSSKRIQVLPSSHSSLEPAGVRLCARLLGLESDQSFRSIFVGRFPSGVRSHQRNCQMSGCFLRALRMMLPFCMIASTRSCRKINDLRQTRGRKSPRVSSRLLLCGGSPSSNQFAGREPNLTVAIRLWRHHPRMGMNKRRRYLPVRWKFGIIERGYVLLRARRPSWRQYAQNPDPCLSVPTCWRAQGYRTGSR